MENSRLRISASISLSIHLLLIFTAVFLFSGAGIRQTSIRHVKVTLHSLKDEKKSVSKFVPPLPVENSIKKPEKREPTLPIPLPVQVVVKDIPVEEPKLISPPWEEEETVNPVRNSSGALNPAGIILKSNPATEQRGIISNGVKEPALAAVHMALDKASNLKQEEKLSISFPPGASQGNNLFDNASEEGAGIGQRGSPGGVPGNGLGTERGGFPLSGSGEGRALGQGGSRGGGSGNGSGSGTGSGEGDSRGGGSQKGTRILGKLFPSSGGVGGGSARYAENPKPPYPVEARKKGMEGEVLLRVEVLANGRVGEIEVKRSSGHDMLDRSALSTVKQWRFIPANRGNGSIPCWVNIPIKFQLQ